MGVALLEGEGDGLGVAVHQRQGHHQGGGRQRNTPEGGQGGPASVDWVAKADATRWGISQQPTELARSPAAMPPQPSATTMTPESSLVARSKAESSLGGGFSGERRESTAI